MQLSALPHRLLDIWRDRRGVALVEFAYTLPLMLTLGLVGLETSNFVISRMRVSQIAMQTADNAARVRDSIDETDINELFIGARISGESIDFGDHGRIILSSLEPTTTGNKQWIRWQRCYGMGTQTSSYGVPTAENASTMTAMGPAGRQITAAPGTAVMFVEIWYEYQPLAFDWLLGHQTFHSTHAFNVRQRNDHVMKNGGLPSGQWSTCNRYWA